MTCRVNQLSAGQYYFSKISFNFYNRSFRIIDFVDYRIVLIVLSILLMTWVMCGYGLHCAHWMWTSRV